MLPDPHEQPLLAVPEFVAASGGTLRRSAVYEAIRRNEIPSVRVGRKVFIPTAAARRLFALDDEGPRRSEGLA